MGYVATIIDTTTGETRTHEMGNDWNDDYFLWTEGNFGCDCNRRDFFGLEREDPSKSYCTPGLVPRFKVPFVTLPSGRKVYIDGE